MTEGKTHYFVAKSALWPFFSCFLWSYLLYLYYLIMASLVKKVIKGKPYYYLVESRRVDGKPRIVRQKYLGSANSIAKKLQAAEEAVEPDAIEVFEFGPVALFFSLAKDLGLLELFNQHLPKRNQGLSVGHYLLIAAINRAVCPRSKRALSDWFKTTSLGRLMPEVELSHLSSQCFWDHMDAVSDEAIEAIELELSQKLIRKFNLDLRCLIYDATNFFTFIDTFNAASELAQRGRNKQRRNDLRQVNLALLVTQGFHLPLFHKVYAGNVVDSVSFGSIVEELVLRIKLLQQHCESITVVLDKGNNSGAAWQTLDSAPELHFVGSLTPSDHSELLEIPEKDFTPLGGEESSEPSRWQGTSVYRTRKVVFGVERTIVLTFNEKLYVKQVATLERELRKRTQKLAEMEAKLKKWHTGESRGGNPPTKQSVGKQVNELLHLRHMKSLIKVDITEGTRFPQISYRIDKRAYQQLKDTLLGKTIIFTDQHSWSNEQIVAAYRGQYDIEDAFKQMKNPNFIAWYPMFHWTDQKIRVHAFYCVIALLLSALVRRTLQAKKKNITLTSALRALATIKEVVFIKEQKQTKKLKLIRKLNQMNELEKELHDIFELNQIFTT